MPPKKSTTRKQAQPKKSIKKTEEQKFEEELLAQESIPPSVDVKDLIPIKMTTRGRVKKANGENTSKEPKQEESSMDRVKTRDLKDHQLQSKKSKFKEEGEDDAEELPSRQGQQSHNDSGISSNQRKMKGKSAKGQKNPSHERSKKSGSRKQVDQSGENEKQTDQDLVQDERPSAGGLQNDVVAPPKKSSSSTRQARIGKKSSTVSVKVSQTAPLEDEKMIDETKQPEENRPNQTENDDLKSKTIEIESKENKQNELSQNAQASHSSSTKKVEEVIQSQISNKKSRKSGTAKKSQETIIEDVLLQEAMNADTVQMAEPVLASENLPQVADFVTNPVIPTSSVPSLEVGSKSQKDKIVQAIQSVASSAKVSKRNQAFESHIEAKIKDESSHALNENALQPEINISTSIKQQDGAQSKKAQAKPRKSDIAQTVQEQQQAIKLTEEELRVKYQENPDYQEWEPRAKRLKVELEKGLSEGLPKIFFSELDFDSVANDFIRLSNIRQQIDDSFANYRLKNIEPSGDGDFQQDDFDQVFNEDEVKRLFFRLIAFKIEGSPFNLKELTQLCHNVIVTDHFPQFSHSLNESHVEQLITIYSERVSYGIKGKNPRTFTDKTPIALWSWKVSDDELLSPVSETQLKKARSQRMIVGKKLTHLHQFLELCSDFSTFDSAEKISKLNQEFEFYTKCLSKENSSDWKQKKRRLNEIIADDAASGMITVPGGSKGARQQPAKKIKTSDDNEHQPIIEASVPSEMPHFNEKSEASGMPVMNKKANPQQIVNQQPEKHHGLENYFKKTQKQISQENISSLQLKRSEELKKNPFIQYTARCITESMKLKQLYSQFPTDSFDSSSIINRFKSLKQQDMQTFQLQRKPKHIQIHDSGMYYPGVYFDKSSRILNCKAPFKKDQSIIDYDQDSDEEWEELHGENLESDDAVVEEMQEVEEDELGLPNAGVSNDIKKRMAFRSQYNFQTLQYKEDDPELREEGFIVADDYFSQESDFFDEQDNDERIVKSRKDLLLKHKEQMDKRTHSNIMRPYIFLDSKTDLGDYKAISLRKKPKITLSRMSFGNISTADESPYAQFPLSVEKPKKKEECKLRINDVISDLVFYSHATILKKKQLIEDIRGKYPDLKKTHIESFVKECFEKQKRPSDSKTRLFANANVVDKYGGSDELIQQLPQIYQDKVAEEKLNAAQELANNPPQNQQSAQVKQSEGQLGLNSDDMPPPAAHHPQKRQSSRARPSGLTKGNQGLSSRKSVKSVANEHKQVHDHTTNQISNSQNQIYSVVAQESVLDQTDSGLQMYENKTSNLSEKNHDEYMQDNQQRNSNIQASEVMVNQDENSWLNAQNAQNVETPAFNSKVYELPPNEQSEDQDFNQEFDVNPQQQPGLHQSHSFYDEPQIQLSQHAIVHHDEEQKHIEIVDNSFQRGNQQHQSTPIHNFRTLRSREISVNHSQQNLLHATNEADMNMNFDNNNIVFGGGETGRPRSDSMETDRGNPMENMPPMTNLESHLEMLGELGQAEGNARGFRSPPSQTNNTKSVFQNMDSVLLFEEQKEVVFEETKEIIDIAEDLNNDVQSHIFIIDNHHRESIHPYSQTNQQETQRKRVARGSTVRGLEGGTESKSQPRRSKRLESKHQLLQMNLQQFSYHQESVSSHYQDQDDELNLAYSQQSISNPLVGEIVISGGVNASKRKSRHRQSQQPHNQ